MSHRSSTACGRRHQRMTSARRLSPQALETTVIIAGVYWFPRMMAGSESWPAVARSVKAHTATSIAPTLPRTATWGRPRVLNSRPGSFSHAYAMTKRGNPPCQNIYNQAVL